MSQKTFAFALHRNNIANNEWSYLLSHDYFSHAIEELDTLSDQQGVWKGLPHPAGYVVKKGENIKK